MDTEEEDGCSRVKPMPGNRQGRGSGHEGGEWSRGGEQFRLSESQLQRTSLKLLLLGDGFDTWTKVNQRMFYDHHYALERDNLLGLMKLLVGTQGIYSCSKRDHGTRLSVVSCPVKVSKKGEVKAWLRWIADLLEEKKDNDIRTIYSPSEKYDSVVKTATLAAGVDGILVNPSAEGVNHYTECREELERLDAYKKEKKEREPASAPAARKEDSDVAEAPSRFPTRTGTPVGELGSADMDFIDLIIDLTADEEEGPSGPAPSPAQGRPRSARLEEAEGASQRKVEEEGMETAAIDWSSRRAQRSEFRPTLHNTDEEQWGAYRPRKKTQKSDIWRMSQSLAPLPPEAICVRMQTGLKVLQIIASPWDVEGDGLIVFTDYKYKIHNRKFREELRQKAGESYHQKSLQLEAARTTVTKGNVFVVNGYNLPYGAVILVPIDAYKKGDNLEDYRKKIWRGLERGLVAGNNEGMRRVVVSVQGLRPPHLPGDTAQSVAENGVVTIAKTNSHRFGFKELVVVVNPCLHRLQMEQGVQMLAEKEEQRRVEHSPPEAKKYPLAIQPNPPPSTFQAGKETMVELIKIELRASSDGAEPQAAKYIKEFTFEIRRSGLEELNVYRMKNERQADKDDGLMRPVKIQPLNSRQREPLRQPQSEDVSDSDEREEQRKEDHPAVEKEESDHESVFTDPRPPSAGNKPLRGEQRWGKKKEAEMVDVKRPFEGYLKDVWPTVVSATKYEGAKKLWITSVTTEPMTGSESAQNHYERLVLEDMDDEKSQIRRARGQLDKGSRLEPLWRTLKQTAFK
ncbi:uncharacterized protein LOC122841377 [Gambusia affinis]|uniref:uncharacterized protein LOC122841377 n=1 Tax=Gambusia affinis TaxID=33528 RepID=UPI001CDD856F|nr:uncharacterized protein LOC122841377 [Gambusia affinis]